MTDTLIKLFGSAARVKLLRLFLFNPKQTISLSDAALRARVTSAEARKEVNLFVRLGLLTKHARQDSTRYSVAQQSEYIEALQNLLLNTPTRTGEMYERFRSVGTIKLLVVSGMFVGEWEGPTDLLFVGDRIKEPLLQRKIKILEAEVGKEVRFVALTTQDFFYRLNMSDRLLRDVFDFTHVIVHDKLDIGLK